MRRVISMSALVSGLLALPVYAAEPREQERSAAVMPAGVDTGGAPVQKLQAMMETGPADVGGMKQLHRKMTLQVQENLGRLLAEGPAMPVENGEAAPGGLKIEGLTFTLPAEAMEQRMEKAAFLGVTTSPVTATLREQLGLTKGVGLVVDFVAKDSPAEAAGLKVHDILQKLDDQLLINAPQLAVLVRSKKAGDMVTLTVIHGGKPVELKAKLVEKEVPVMEEEGMHPGWQPFRPMPGNMTGHIEGMMGEDHGGWQKGTQAKVMVGDDGSMTTEMTDADGQITLKKDKEGKTTIVAKDQAGKETYSGPFTTEEDKKKAPAAIAAKVAKMQIGEGQIGEGRLRIELGGDGQFSGNAVTHSGAVMNRSDEVHSIMLSISDNKDKSVVVKDAKSGKVIYEGPANSEEDFKMMPEGVAEKVKAMEGKVGGK